LKSTDTFSRAVVGAKMATWTMRVLLAGSFRLTLVFGPVVARVYGSMGMRIDWSEVLEMTLTKVR
jgi:hypothetical protein